MDKKLSELIGIIIGDGNVCYIPKIRKYYIEITGNPKNEGPYYDYISQLFLDLMGKTGTIFLRNRGLRIRVYSKEFVEFLINNIGLCFGAGKFWRVEMPGGIITSSKNVIYSCVRGIFDTDGTFFVSKKGLKDYPSIEIVTCSRKLAIQLYGILGDEFRVNLRCRDCEKYTTGRAYVISLYGFEQTKKWFEIIGSSNLAKSQKYQNFIKSFK